MARTRPQVASTPPAGGPHDGPDDGPDEGPYEVSQHGTKYRPSTRPRGRGADFDNARQYFADPGINGWLEKMRTDPSVFTHLLSDLVRETRAEKERLAGQAKIGRRPRVIDGSLSELWDMITPRYATVPFPEALRALGDISPAEFAHKTTLSPDTYRKMMRGEALDMWRIEVVARGLGVSPAYFREWRTDYVLTVVSELLDQQPNLTIRYAKFMAKVAGSPQPTRAARKSRRREPIAAV